MAARCAAQAVELTPFLAGAVGELLELWRTVMPADAPDRARFADLALLNPAFDPAGLQLLWTDGRLIGFGYAVAGALAPDGSRPGWLAGLGVAPEHRRAGHGTRLLEACLHFLADAGCTVAALGGNGERYLLPGADPAVYPAFRELLLGAGFRLAGRTEAMRCELAGAAFAGPEAPTGPFSCRHPADGDYPELLHVVATFSPSWAELVRSYLARDSGTSSHGADHLWAAYAANGIAGFAGSDLFPGCPGRFGPMGVLPAARGHGTGGRLLRLSLGSMAGRGHSSAWFLWGPEGQSGRRMYVSAGFRVSREFEFYERELSGWGLPRSQRFRTARKAS